MQPHEVPTVTVAEMAPGSVLIDVREDDEWAAGHIDGALHIPMNQIPQHLNYRPESFASDQPLVIVCAVGGRSAHVTAWLLQNGIDAVNLEGGMGAWVSAGKEVIQVT
jgi:rhodanese-related sulfurtransferase